MNQNEINHFGFNTNNNSKTKKRKEGLARVFPMPILRAFTTTSPLRFQYSFFFVNKRRLQSGFWYNWEIKMKQNLILDDDADNELVWIVSWRLWVWSLCQMLKTFMYTLFFLFDPRGSRDIYPPMGLYINATNRSFCSWLGPGVTTIYAGGFIKKSNKKEIKYGWGVWCYTNVSVIRGSPRQKPKSAFSCM